MKKLTIVLLSLSLAASGFAATFTRKSGDTFWSNQNQWNTGTLPGRADDVVINAGKTLLADTDATVNTILAPNASGHTATLIISEDITLGANMVYIGRGAYSGATSTINHSRGTVDAGTLYVAAGEGSTSTYNLSGDAELTGVTLDVGQVSDSRSTGSATFNQTGGTVSSETVQIAGKGNVSYTVSGGQMKVADLSIGSGASPARSTLHISADADSISIADNLIAGPRARLEFELSKSGAATIEVADKFKITSPSAKLIIDAANYTGKGGTIKLVTFKAITDEFSSVEITNLDPSLIGSVGYNSKSMYLRITPAQTSK